MKISSSSKIQGRNFSPINLLRRRRLIYPGTEQSAHVHVWAVWESGAETAASTVNVNVEICIRSAHL